jgi:hypothetical protein
MNEFIEKNRGLLKFYHFAAKIIGWILIGVAPVFIFISIHSVTSIPSEANIEANIYLLLLGVQNLIVYYFCLGLILLGIARFIKYLYSEESQPGWILRHFEKFLYIYAFLMVVGVYFEFKNPGINSGNPILLHMITYVLSETILTSALVLIIIGLGHIIRRILPVIEESKSLV